ncbi:Fungal Zn(2)-Cys(6) binuclear cluster domain-containing protein 9 [Elsinoe fawcettii]|nr:Fungal Zn(2)-Cys(6) binuclear cluster domain-containing protein 9 [Elsinoe fawcettii]
MKGVAKKASPRVQLSCDPCKSSKLKCDREVPICGQCRKRLRDSACRYTQRGLRFNAEDRHANITQAKIERLELVVSQLQQGQTSCAASQSASTRTATSLRDQDGPAISPGYWKADQRGVLQWLGRSSWASLAAELNLANDSAVSEAASCFKTEGPMLDGLFGTSRAVSRSYLISALPPPNELDTYISTWFNSHDPMSIIVHIPDFHLKLQEFRSDPASVSASWLALMLAIAFLGAEIFTQSLSDDSLLHKAHLVKVLTGHALAAANVMKPQEYLIEALVLYTSGLILHEHEITNAIWHLSSTAIRLCQQAGYHRNCNVKPDLSDIQYRMHRATWLVACELENMTSLNLGMVSFNRCAAVGDRSPSKDLPSNSLLEDLSPASPKHKYSLVQAQTFVTNATCTLAEIVEAVDNETISRSSVRSSFVGRLADDQSALPCQLRMGATDSDPKANLSMMIEKYATENHQCIQAAKTIVTHCVAMLEDMRPSGRLASTKALLFRHVHEFMFAAMLLCRYIRQSDPQNSATAEEITTTTEVLQHVCRLWQAEKLRSKSVTAALKTVRMVLSPLDPGSAEEEAMLWNEQNKTVDVATAAGGNVYLPTQVGTTEDGTTATAAPKTPFYAGFVPFANFDIPWDGKGTSQIGDTHTSV